MTSARSILLLLLLSVSTFVAQAQIYANGQMCCLCNGCGFPVSSRQNYVLNRNGDTCLNMALKMANPRNMPGNSGTCRSYQNAYRNTCCNAATQVQAQQPANTQSQVSQQRNPYSRGNYRACNLCFSGRYPTKPNTLTAVLYMPGTYTCKDLFWMGRAGRIPDRICNPMQDFMAGPCGCS